MARSDPSRILDALTAYWQTEALAAAIDLGLFTALGSGVRSSAQLARACRADAAALARLCGGLVAMGLLRRRGAGYAAASDAARFLDERSPHSIASARRFLVGSPMRSAFANLAGTVRRRRPAHRVPVGGKLWRDFAAAMTPVRRVMAVAVADLLRARGLARGRILDVGSGASPLGIELVRRTPGATLVALDRASVVRHARRGAQRAGVASRVATRAGDVRSTRWGGPYDLILMINVLDYFDDAAGTALLGKARAALRPGGALVVHAPMFDRLRHSPPEAVAQDLMLLALGAAGSVRTFGEIRRICRAAGFESVMRAGSPLIVVLARKRR